MNPKELARAHPIIARFSPLYSLDPLNFYGAPGRSRTCDLRFRKLLRGARVRSWWPERPLWVAKLGKACPGWSSEKQQKKLQAARSSSDVTAGAPRWEMPAGRTGSETAG